MAVHTRLTKREISDILRVYRIGNLLNFSGIQEGIENTNYKIKTTNNYYILTIFEERVNKKNLPFFLNLMLNCSKKKICCPKPILDTSGKLTNNFKKMNSSNFEKKIAEQIKTAVSEASLESEIEEVLVPTEEVIEVRRGKKVTTERRFMPGYVLVRMEMSDQGYHLINSINRVTGFLGPQGRPMPMRDAEVNAILNRVQEGEDAPRTLINFEVGEKVKVNDGPFEDFDGLVELVDEDNQRLKVTVSIFGRETPVELEFTQVTKQT